MAKILVIDDEESIRTVLSMLFAASGHEAVAAPDGNFALERIAEEDFDLVMCDMRMHPMDGMEVLEKALKIRPQLRFIMLTAFSSVEVAEKALELGAFDFMTKPWKLDEMLLNVERALTGNARPAASDADLAEPLPVAEWEGEPWADEAKRLASSTGPVLIHCAGVDRVTVARAVHDHGSRKNAPFTVLPCGSLPEPILEVEMLGCRKGELDTVPDGAPSIFEKTEGGIVLLDEIAWMPHKLQEVLAKIIRDGALKRIGGIEDIILDVDLIASTSNPLDALQESHSIIPELYELFGDNKASITNS